MKSFHKISFRIIVLTGGLTFGSLASLAFAADPKAGKPDAEFTAMDTNKDGKVSVEEQATASKKMFDMMDANRDGKVTAAEMTAAHPRVTGKKAKKSDMSSADKSR